MSKLASQPKTYKEGDTYTNQDATTSIVGGVDENGQPTALVNGYSGRNDERELYAKWRREGDVQAAALAQRKFEYREAELESHFAGLHAQRETAEHAQQQNKVNSESYQYPFLSEYFTGINHELDKWSLIADNYTNNVLAAPDWQTKLSLASQFVFDHSVQTSNILLQASAVPVIEYLGLLDTGNNSVIEYEFGGGASKQAGGGLDLAFGLNNQGEFEFGFTVGRDVSLDLLPARPAFDLNFSLTKAYDTDKISDLIYGHHTTYGVDLGLTTKVKPWYIPDGVKLYEGYTSSGFIGTSANIPDKRTVGIEVYRNWEAPIGPDLPVNFFVNHQYVPKPNYTFKAGPSPIGKTVFGVTNLIFQPYEWLTK